MAPNTNSAAESRPHRWRFLRSGGFDQVRLETGADLMALDELDQKLWAALSCPTHRLEFDERTLQLIDTDDDGQIRPPELIAAVKWAGSLLKDPNDLTGRAEALPLSAVREDTEEASTLLRSAREILSILHKPGAEVITTEDTADTAKIFANTPFNGDGIIPPESASDEATKQAIEQIIGCMGSENDRSGQPGVSEEQVDEFFRQAEAYDRWWKKAEADADNILPFGDRTPNASKVFNGVKEKVDDYFTRCRVAEFDDRAADSLNPAQGDYEAISPSTLSPATAELAAFPLATVAADKPLPLETGVNPAWGEAIENLRNDVAAPLFGTIDGLSNEQWMKLDAKFALHEAWLADKEGAMVESLALEGIRELLSNGSREAIGILFAKDKELMEEMEGIGSVDRLIRYHRDLFELLNNFVAFRDFYTPGKHAIFQTGTLYLDTRSCDLCIKVDDVAKHSSMAGRSRTFLTYCNCKRKGSDETMNIVVGITDGDSDDLMVGRNGVFYDRKGNDWDATITKLVEHPISVRQAFWSPYKRVGRMIQEQIEKMAAAGDKAVESRAAAGVADLSKQAGEGKAKDAAPFDVGKFAGIFAAIGLALGAIGTAVASVLTGLMQLSLWQMPLAVLGLLLVISGPSMVIAYLKLRRRNLAPLLDANGWAVNTKAMINLPFGASLTHVAALPPGAKRSMRDPYAQHRTPWTLYGVLTLLLIVFGYLWEEGYLAKWRDQIATRVEQATQQPRKPAAEEPKP
ncbi:MAG: hypothetical protein U9Q81_00445 [Pseudomonadota bacterium]|nr:hypothetical protein [Pseudomonadota bacterium]